jgi:hypothetical protein
MRHAASARNEIGGEVRIYPNPNNGKFTIELPYIEDKALITVSDVAGRTIHSRVVRDGDGNTIHLDLGSIARGVYIVEVSFGDQRVRTKLVVQ